jgi:hypothetical protein
MTTNLQESQTSRVFGHAKTGTVLDAMAIDFAEFRCIPIASLLHEFYIGHLE